jgi:type II secretory pathway pseudopilin PulG
MALMAAARSRAFTLAEFLVVTLVIVFFLGGVLVPFSAYLQTSRISNTQSALEVIREKLYQFASRNGRLPCPADPAGTTGLEWIDPATSRCLGIPAAATFPATATGVLPWATLQLAEADAWGSRYTYSVQSEWADGVLDAGCSPRDRFTSFCTSSLASLAVQTRPAPGVGTQSTGLQLVAVVLSPGPNARGGYAAGGIPQALPAGADELQNRLAFIGAGQVQQITTFISRDSTPVTAPCDDAVGPAFCEYDDRMVFVSKAQLLARLAADGRFP